MKYKLTDWEPGAKYATGTTPSGKWKWKDIDKKFVDMLNVNWEKAQGIEPDQPIKKKGKNNATS